MYGLHSVPNDHLILKTYNRKFLHAFAHVGDQRQHVLAEATAGFTKNWA